ncbi:hypothetical protein A2108_00615 [Candidatus Wolfebacteria bacterium GWA1_42_9]|uniref:EamA domain-containing protein n=1 Tax=Candidatus Wolfebacteria bacterium GWA1_42_9 TaxID=1802553 RepID=A0A1F8DL98_9BACT|nr:MAG: hypothetical protein US39_C0020G0008 [Microgenomates group bacterium GW2011_GWC1_37_12b]KKT22896.1 MAG: Conserved hypothetical membrane protein, DUF6 family [Parcubacteria group bacterium GW2011_GWB1_43_8b]OGM89374.1 MAG: hypothetical protein A2108_00615 [Candidatus Wolfebacteria bacterium GWA1_42_9]
MSWILFTLGATALNAVSNFIDKFLIEKRVRDYITLTILGGMVAFIFGIVVLFFRNFPIYGTNQMILILLAGISMEMGLIPYYKAISLDDISRVVPVFQIAPVFVLILSYVFLGERLTLPQFIGFWMIITGAYILSLKKLGKDIFNLRKSVIWIILASILWAIPSVIFRFVTIEINFWDALGYEFIGAAIGMLLLFLIPAIRNRFLNEIVRVEKSAYGAIASNEFIYLIARMLGFYAIVIAPAVSLVSVLGGFHPLIVLIYGIILSVWFPNIIKEDIQKATIFIKILAIVVIFVGVWFINV